MPAHRLELEITESVLLQNSEATLAVLHELRGFGVRISLDDFGTGYSSLSYLRSFPFDKIKIDRSFVSELATRDDSMAIVRAVTGLGKSLGIVTTAEGVETDAQFDLLRREGCTQAQGYLFSRPRPAAEVETMLSRAAGAGCRLIRSSLVLQALRSAKCAPQNAIAAPRHKAARPASTPDMVGTGLGAEAACPAPARISTPTAIRNWRIRCGIWPGDRAVHQVGGEIAAGKADGRDQPPRDRRARRHEFAGIGSPQAAEIEAVARAQHVHGQRQQHSGNHRAGQNQAARKIGRLGHGPLVR